MSVHTIDCDYMGEPGVAAAYLVVEGREAAFVETNTSQAVPRLLEALEAQGLGPDAVRYVVVTHIHLDHAGGAGVLMDLCPRATLLAHPRAAPHAIDPSRLVASAQAVYGEERFRELYGEIRPVPAERVRQMADGETLVWGRRTWTFHHTRGHANHHFVVHDDLERGVFTGDAFGIGYPAVQEGGPWVFPSTSPTDFDPDEAIASVRRIVATGADRVWLTHFGERTDLGAVADGLIRELRAYGALVDEADRSGAQGEALEARVRSRVDRWFRQALEARGLEDDDRAVRLTSIDRELNAQGIAVAVARRRRREGRV